MLPVQGTMGREDRAARSGALVTAELVTREGQTWRQAPNSSFNYPYPCLPGVLETGDQRPNI